MEIDFIKEREMVQDIGYTNPIYNTRLGRANIYTNVPWVTRDNLIDVLSSARSTHLMNVADIRKLLKFIFPQPVT